MSGGNEIRAGRYRRKRPEMRECGAILGLARLYKYNRRELTVHFITFRRVNTPLREITQGGRTISKPG